MASVIPSVIVAITLLASILVILGGIAQYYASISMEPALLPAYGTVYVESVDTKDYTVTIVNRYGYTVKTLFTVYVKDTPGLPYSMRSISPYASFWVNLYPGINIIKLTDHVKSVLGLPESSRVILDLSKSYFIIGEVKYPIITGSGLLKPVETGKSFTRTFKVNGLGVHSLSSNRLRYVSIVFKSSEIDTQHNIQARMGYPRSVYDYERVTRTTYLVTGYICSCWTRYFYGYERRWREVIDWECLDECLDSCYESCRRSGGGDWCYYTCYKICRRVCSYWESYCAGTWCPHTDCSKSYYHHESTRSFGCAYDGYIYMYWTPILDGSHKLRFNTIALYSVKYFDLEISKDIIKKTFDGTPYKSEEWPYILKNQKLCQYTYIHKECKASLKEYIFKACDYSCGVDRIYHDCDDWCYIKERGTKWACGSKKCADTKRFLYAKIEDIEISITSPLTSKKDIKLEFNILYTFKYYNYEDPEAVSKEIFLWLRSRLKLVFPKLLGYIGISYADKLSDVKVRLKTDIMETKAVIRTKSGYTIDVPILVTINHDTYHDVSITPIGYILDNTKTFKYEAKTKPVIEIKMESPGNGFKIPRLSSDTIMLKVNIVLTITPELVVEVNTK